MMTYQEKERIKAASREIAELLNKHGLDNEHARMVLGIMFYKHCWYDAVDTDSSVRDIGAVLQGAASNVHSMDGPLPDRARGVLGPFVREARMGGVNGLYFVGATALVLAFMMRNAEGSSGSKGNGLVP